MPRKLIILFRCKKVLFIEATRAKSYHGEPPHVLQVQHNPDQFHKALGTQVLMDILLLAKCDHFLHIESSVAALASYFNPVMKSHFLDDTPEKVGPFQVCDVCLFQDSYRVLNSWKSLEIRPAIFRTWKVWKMEIKCGEMVKSIEFFQRYNKCFRGDMFSFWSNPIQSRQFVCSASWKELCFCVFYGLHWSPIW